MSLNHVRMEPSASGTVKGLMDTAANVHLILQEETVKVCNRLCNDLFRLSNQILDSLPVLTISPRDLSWIP